MMRLIGWGALLCVAFAALAWGVWSYALGRQDLQLELYERAAKSRHVAARLQPADAATFRATVCATTPCVLVEAGGLAFVVGAGDGAAERLSELGLLRPDLDGILLTDIGVGSIEGLPDLRHATWRAGRKAPLAVYGPPGAERVVDGVNLMMAASDIEESRMPSATPLSAGGALLVSGPEPGPEGLSGLTVFDSGVVKISSFPVAGQGASWVYRFDFNNQSLIVAGCAARATDILTAVRGARQAAAILPASSSRMLEIDRKAASASRSSVARPLAEPGGQTCLSQEDAIAAMRDAHLTGGLLAPLYPPISNPPALRAWRELVAPPEGLSLAPGEPGDQIDLSGQTPVIQKPGASPRKVESKPDSTSAPSRQAPPLEPPATTPPAGP
jgi:hypothetical protein